MKSQSLLDGVLPDQGTSKDRSSEWDAYRGGVGPGTDDLEEKEVLWQKHVVVLIWVAFIVLLLLGVALLYAKSHGLFHAVPGHGTPLPHLWPEG